VKKFLSFLEFPVLILKSLYRVSRSMISLVSPQLSVKITNCSAGPGVKDIVRLCTLAEDWRLSNY